MTNNNTPHNRTAQPTVAPRLAATFAWASGEQGFGRFDVRDRKREPVPGAVTAVGRPSAPANAEADTAYNHGN